MPLPILLRWPDELIQIQSQLIGIDKIACLWRLDKYHEAELQILAQLPDGHDHFYHLILLSLCAESQNRSAQLHSLLEHLSRHYSGREMTRWLKLRHWLNKLDADSIHLAGSDIWIGEEDSSFLTILRCRFLLASRQVDELKLKLESLDPVIGSCLEIQQCKGDLAALLGDHDQALDVWKSLIHRCPGSRSIFQRVIKLALTCRNSEVLLRAFRIALDRFGEHPDFLPSLTAIKLHQRQPGLGQRSSLLSMVWRSLGLAGCRYRKSVFFVMR